ncbi:hypothetical protein ELH80_09060 [Rhizobium ruizarguesonis]|nr:hypothetical protein ELH86_36985 [Rhizobium ruizarguesonis]TAZ34534.1 hypothetical protein ELH80_09060 [Rhizobium ruizarguesonis]TBA54489.1 hypothetical protein ELH58_36650 [Rhizobium ruizarguesonis]
MSRSRQRKRQCRTHVVLLLKRQQWVGFNANTSRSNEPRLMQMLAMESGAVLQRNRLRLKISQAVLHPCQAHAATRVAKLTKLSHCRPLAKPTCPKSAS